MVDNQVNKVDKCAHVGFSNCELLSYLSCSSKYFPVRHVRSPKHSATPKFKHIHPSLKKTSGCRRQKISLFSLDGIINNINISLKRVPKTTTTSGEQSPLSPLTIGCFIAILLSSSASSSCCGSQTSRSKRAEHRLTRAEQRAES